MVTSFHVGIGGNKDGIGQWMRSLNDAGIPFPLKSVDEYGVLFEALTVGIERNITNWLVYRMSEFEHSAAGVRETPDYTLPPYDAAVKHWLPIEAALPPEFDKMAVYIEPFNEIRMKKSPDDVQYKDMNAADWMGECCYHLATFANERGYKVALPAINSGEPGEKDAGMMDVVTQYSQPGMLKLIAYAAEHPDMCLLSIHEYIWDRYLHEDESWADWYPYLFGRFEGLIAAADNAGIPRTFKCIVSEWGFDREKAPRWNEAKPIIEQYTAWMVRWAQIIVGTTAWTLQNGEGGVDNDVQTWIEPLIHYTIYERPLPAEQPQITHELFGSTLPQQEKPPMINTQTIDIPEDATNFEIGIVNKSGEIIDPTIFYDGENLPIQIMVTSTLSGEIPPPQFPAIVPNALGVDVSAHQGKFDWETAVSNGVTYAIIRSSNGLGSTSTDQNGRDEQLFRNAGRLTERNMPWAVYHFLQDGQSIVKQAELVNDILAELKALHMYPKTAVFNNGVTLPTLFIDVEKATLTPDQIKLFADNIPFRYGIYTRKSLWNPIMAGTAVWWENICCWVAAYGKNDGSVPPWKPGTPYGFKRNTIWQYTSQGGHIIGSTAGLDLNIATPFEQETEPPDIDPPTGKTYDLLGYMMGDGRLFEFQLSDANRNATNQERNQTQSEGELFYIVKGENQGVWERYHYNDEYILQDTDTSPANASDGTERYYQVRRADGVTLVPYTKRHMKIGEKFIGSPHWVQFYRKSDCELHPENSGEATNVTTLIAHYDFYEFDKLTVADVVVVESGGETHWFARGYGRVAWYSIWGNAEISEEHAPGQRPDIVREVIGCLD